MTAFRSATCGGGSEGVGPRSVTVSTGGDPTVKVGSTLSPSPPGCRGPAIDEEVGMRMERRMVLVVVLALVREVAQLGLCRGSQYPLPGTSTTVAGGVCYNPDRTTSQKKKSEGAGDRAKTAGFLYDESDV